MAPYGKPGDERFQCPLSRRSKVSSGSISAIQKAQVANQTRRPAGVRAALGKLLAVLQLAGLGIRDGLRGVPSGRGGHVV
jgi:hypothetical protein